MADSSEEVWKVIWSLQAPPAFRSFCWKVRNNLLATKSNLFSKKIVNDPICPLCQSEIETIFHCLWGCLAAVGVWQEGSRKIQKLSCHSTDGRGLLLFFLDRLEAEEMLEALTMNRLIWHR